MKKMTQKEQILAILGRGWTHFDRLNSICFRYSARIYDLRRDGHNIEKKQVKGVWYYRLANNLKEPELI